MKKPLVSLVLLSLTLVACNKAAPKAEEPAPPEEPVAMEVMEEAGDKPFSGENLRIEGSRSSLTFTGKSNIINHEGGFREYSVMMALDPMEPSNLEKGKMDVSINVASVYADTEALQQHLLREDFFAAEQYPAITFATTSIESHGGFLYALAGELTIKGITHSVVFPALITDEGLTMNFDLPRQAFNIGNDSYGDKLLEPLVPVAVKLAFVK